MERHLRGSRYLMYYVIERVTDIPFDNSFKSFKIGSLVFDVVKAQKNTGLDSVSSFIVDDNNVLYKSDISIESKFKEIFKRDFGIELNELLLG